MKTNKIAFVIDGYYGLTLYKDIKRTYGKFINFETLVEKVCKALSLRIDENCISPANLRHYYMGTNLVRFDKERNEYENSLKLSRFGARGRPLQNGKEKGIDTMLYSDIKEEANAGSFDYLILLAGDLDHITLVQDLKDMGIRTVLIYGEIVINGHKTTGFSTELQKACFDSVDLYELLDNEEIFLSANKHFVTMTEYMRRGAVTNNALLGKWHTEIGVSPRKSFISDNNTHGMRTQALPNSGLLEGVIETIKTVILENEKIKGRKLVFALQSQVGTRLKRIGIHLPYSLGEYLESYPRIFKTGKHPVTKALTVSIR